MKKATMFNFFQISATIAQNIIFWQPLAKKQWSPEWLPKFVRKIFCLLSMSKLKAYEIFKF